MSLLHVYVDVVQVVDSRFYEDIGLDVQQVRQFG